MSTSSAEHSLARGFDHLDPAVAATVHDTLGELRKRCPVARSEKHGGFFVVTSAEAIVEVGQRHEVYSSAVAGLGAVMLLPGIDTTRATLFEQDPPQHTPARRVLAALFSRAAAMAREPYIRQVTQDVLGEIGPRGQGDLVADLAARVPPMITAELLGVPESQRATLRTLAANFFASGSLPSEQARVAMADFAEFLLDHVRTHRHGPGDNAVRAVAETVVDGQVPTEIELVKYLYLMVAAGNLTTTDTLANTLYLLGANPAIRERVAADRSLLPALIEESVRHEAAVAATGRTVRRPTRLSQVDLAPGDRLLLCWGSATRDPTEYDRPDEVDIDREHGRHLGWGAGAHRCLGQHLARLVLRTVLDAVLDTMGDYRFPPGFQPSRTYGVLRGIHTLPATWTPTA